MNSDDIIRRLNRMVNDPKLSPKLRNEIAEAIRHIKKQDDEMLELKEDITDWGDK